MATIKSVLESLDNVPAELHEYYTEKDGVFHLNLTDDIRTHPKTQALQNAHERTKAELKTLKTERDELAARHDWLPEDFDAEKLAELQAAADAAGGKKIDEQLTALRTQLEEKHRKAIKAKEDEIAAKEKQIGDLTGDIRKSKIDIELDSALDAAKIDPKHRRAVKALLKTDAKIEMSDDGEVIVQTSGGFPVALKDYVVEQSEADLKPYILMPSGDGGRGGNGDKTGGGSNPFLAAQWNKTAQSKLPAEKREILAKAAGFSSADQALKASKPIKAA